MDLEKSSGADNDLRWPNPRRLRTGRFGLSANQPIVGMTMLFLTLAIGSMLDIFPIKTRGRLNRAAFTVNPILTGSLLGTITLILLLATVAPLQQVFRLAPLNLGQWLIVLAVIWVADAGCGRLQTPPASQSISRMATIGIDWRCGITVVLYLLMNLLCFS